MSINTRKRKRVDSVTSIALPFGFDMSTHLERLIEPQKIGKKTHSIQNYIIRFDQHGQPIFQFPDQYKISSHSGILVKIRDQETSKRISELHTSYTVHLYHMAHKILSMIKKQPRVEITRKESCTFKQVDIRSAKYNQRKNKKNLVYLNAIHMGQRVIMKTTSDPANMLKYILEAVIHHYLQLKTPRCVPKLCFVGCTKSGRLVTCSEQLVVPPIADWLVTRSDNNEALLHMLKNVCHAFRVIQRDAHFTHRDSHTANVYYDERRRIIKFIDFDWSCIQTEQKIVSVPRFLYDTTRPGYGKNRSVDLCIFMRCLGKQLQPGVFLNKIWKPLMSRYEQDCETALTAKMKTEEAAMQIYKLSTDTGNIKGKYAHTFGIKRHGKEFDYLMGYYEWNTMTPKAILQFLKTYLEY